MIEAFRNIFRIPELKRRVFFTLGLLFVYRLGCQVPTPGVNAAELKRFFEAQSETVFGFLNLFTGGALMQASVFALGIMPYISASIIMQLLTAVIPHLERLSKEGEIGRRKITQYTRYATVGICLVQSLGTTYWLRGVSAGQQFNVLPEFTLGFQAMTMLTLTTGTIFIMWLGEQITEKGIGNGMSIIICAGIIASLPGQVVATYMQFKAGGIQALHLLLFLVMSVALVSFIILIQQGYRRIPVQYAKRRIGRRVYGGQNTQIPLKVDYSGVIAVIFASSILVFPSTITSMFGAGGGEGFLHSFMDFVSRWMAPTGLVYNFLFAALIIFFCYFYTAIVFNPADLAENLQKQGGLIYGTRPGKSTSDYIDRVLTRITLWGAIAIAVIAIVPTLYVRYVNIPVSFGGTSLLIVVGVVLDTMKQVESHLIMRHYDGFLRKGKLKGRTF